MAKYTKLPWRTTKYTDDTEEIRGPRVYIYAPSKSGIHDVCPVMAIGETKEEAKANAAFIVKACNMHDKLVAALQKMVTECTECGGMGEHRSVTPDGTPGGLMVCSTCGKSRELLDECKE